MTKKAVSTKQRLIKAAIHCMATQGVPETRLVDIAAKAKVKHPLVKYYFPSEKHLHLEIAQHIITQLREYVGERVKKCVNDPKRAVIEYISSYFTWAEENQGEFSLVLYLYYLASHDVDFKQMNDVIRKYGRDHISALLFEGIAKGRLRVADPNRVPEIALCIQGLITGNLLLAATEKSVSWTRASELTVERSVEWVS